MSGVGSGGGIALLVMQNTWKTAWAGTAQCGTGISLLCMRVWPCVRNLRTFVSIASYVHFDMLAVSRPYQNTSKTRPQVARVLGCALHSAARGGCCHTARPGVAASLVRKRAARGVALAAAAVAARRAAAAAARPRRSPRCWPPQRRATTAASDAAAESAAPDSAALLSRVAVVLHQPQGPVNVGAVARSARNFGLSDVRVVDPFPEVLSSPADASADAGPGDGSEAYSGEVYQYCTENGKPLLEGSLRGDLADALSDCTMVLALTARTRGGQRELGAREAAEAAVEAASRPGGRVALLFGNERTGLSNDDLRWAHATVAIPTAPTPDGVDGNHQALNLSHAVAVMCYEQMLAAEAVGGPLPSTAISNPKAMPPSGSLAAKKLAPVGLRQRLVEDMLKAVDAVELLGPAPDECESDGEGGSSGPPEGVVGGGTPEEHASEWTLRREKDLRAIERVLASGDMFSADCEVLFRLARRVQALQALQLAEGGRGDKGAGGKAHAGILDTPALDAASKISALSDAGGLPWRERSQRERSDIKKALGEVLGEVNLSNREMQRLCEAVSDKVGRSA